MILNCIICDNSLEDLILLNDNQKLMYCTNCFHISQNKQTNKSHRVVSICKEILNFKENYVQMCLEKIRKRFYDKNDKPNILCINDNSTFLLDAIKKEYPHAKTVSLSNYFNPSFFSKHYHDKDEINESSIERIVKSFETFDFIFVNTTLNGSNDPEHFLQLCKRVSNKSTNIVCVTFHSILMSCYYLMNFNSDILNIFNTNSLKLLCERNDLMIKQTEHLTSDLNVYTITNVTKSDVAKSDVLSEVLYEEITHDTYDNDTYDTIKHFWVRNLFTLQSTIDKYKRQDFKIIGINKCECCLANTYYTKLHNVDLTCNLSEISKRINVFNKNDNFVFIIFDYNNFFNKSSKLASEVNVTKSLILDPVECIGFPL